MSGSVQLVLEFYDEEHEGNLLYSEEFEDVLLEDGLYSIDVGTGNNQVGTVMDIITSQTDEIWLAETVDEQTLTPRIQFGSAIFSLKSQYAEGLVIPGTSTVAVSVSNEGHVAIGEKRNEPQDLLTLFVPPEGDNGIVLTEGSNNGARISYNESGNFLRIAGYHFGTLRGGLAIARRSGHVGIGTTNPISELHVEGDVMVSGLIESTSKGIKFPDGTKQKTSAKGDGSSLDSADGSLKNVLSVSNAGHVGIGKARNEPQELLTLFVPPAGDAGIVLTEGSNNGARISYNETGNFLRIAGYQSGTMRGGLAIARGSGHVGIGTINPASELHVEGDVMVSGLIESTSGGIKFRDGTKQTSAADTAAMAAVVKELNTKYEVAIDQLEKEVQFLKDEINRLRDIVAKAASLSEQVPANQEKLGLIENDHNNIVAQSQE